MADNASIDKNFTRSLLGVSSVDGTSTVKVYADPTTHRLLVDATGAIGASFQTDTFTSTNNQTTFVPSKTVVYDNGFYVNGSRQSPATNYSIIGGSYVLNSGIPSGCDIIISYTTT
jgi:hypothetical protein